MLYLETLLTAKAPIRTDEVINLLRLENLNDKEKANVTNLVIKHCDRFYLPTEYLNKTNATTHNIVTLDDTPAHTK